MKRILFIEDDPLKRAVIRERAADHENFDVDIFTCEVEFVDFCEGIFSGSNDILIPDLLVVDLMLEWNSEDYPGRSPWPLEDPDMAGERIFGLIPKLEAATGKKIECIFWTAIGSDTLPQDRIFYKDDIKLPELFEDLIPKYL